MGVNKSTFLKRQGRCCCSGLCIFRPQLFIVGNPSFHSYSHLFNCFSSCFSASFTKIMKNLFRGLAIHSIQETDSGGILVHFSRGNNFFYIQVVFIFFHFSRLDLDYYWQDHPDTIAFGELRDESAFYTSIMTGNTIGRRSVFWKRNLPISSRILSLR